jgi:hypothetical protein
MMGSAGAPGAQTGPNLPVRVVRAWRALTRDQRVSAVAALALLLTMFLPWYSVTVSVAGSRTAAGASLSAWNAFGLVQAIVLLISLGTLVLLFVRGERRALGGESGDAAPLIVLGGFVAAVLILYAMFDRPGGKLAVASGISWGIVIALLAAIWLGWSGLAAFRRHGNAAATDADGPGERRPARGENAPAPRRVDSDPARRADARRLDADGNREQGPPEPAAPLGGALRREDAAQLSFELPRDD